MAAGATSCGRQDGYLNQHPTLRAALEDAVREELLEKDAAPDGDGHRRTPDHRDGMNVYGHVSLDDKRDALDKLGDLFEEGQK